MFELVRDGKVAQIYDIETDEGKIARVQDIARARGFRSVLLVPLKIEAGPIGLISVTRKKPGTFAPHHVALLQTFANQASYKAAALYVEKILNGGKPADWPIDQSSRFEFVVNHDSKDARRRNPNVRFRLCH